MLLHPFPQLPPDLGSYSVGWIGCMNTGGHIGDSEGCELDMDRLST